MSLLDIQRQLKAPKGQYNDFGKYKYRSCEDILESVKKFLGDCVLTLTDSIELVGDRYYVKATARLVDGDTVHEVSAYAREDASLKGMHESQITGAASSYARKYALNGLFLIDDTKDADATNTHGKGQGEPAETTNGKEDTPEQAKYRKNIEAWLLMDCNGSDNQVASRLTDLIGREVHSVKDLTIDELRKVWPVVSKGRKVQ